MENTANSVGRPTSYKEEYNEQAYKLCLLGATDKDLSDFFKVTEQTINNWKNDFPKFFESISLGKEKADMEVAQSLYKGAIDRTVPKEQAFKVKEVFYENGKRVKEEERIEVVVVDEFVPSDFRNVQFWLKNRKSDRWRDKQEIDHTSGGEKIEPTRIVFGSKGKKEDD